MKNQAQRTYSALACQRLAIRSQVAGPMRRAAGHGGARAGIANLQISSNSPGAVIHNVQAHASCSARVSSDSLAVVTNFQLQPFVGRTKSDVDMAGSAVLHGIVHGFLGNPV